MALVRVTRTVLVEQSFTVEIQDHIVLYPHGVEMEDGKPFFNNALLIEKEIDSIGFNTTTIKSSLISNPVIIKIEQV